MKKWITCFISFCLLIFSVVSFAQPTMQNAYSPLLSIVPSSVTAISITASGSTTRGYTVTNNTTKSVNTLLITPAFKAEALLSGSSVSANTCTGTLTAGASCTFTANIQSNGTLGTTTLMPRVCVSNGVNCSVPVASNRVAVTVNAAPTLTSIAITPTSPTNIRRSTTVQFTATGTYSDSTTADITTSVSWNSSNTTPATIGLNTGLLSTTTTVGSTNITASLNSVTSNTVALNIIDFAYIGNYTNSTVVYCPVSNADGTLSSCTAVTNAGAGNGTFNGVADVTINPAGTILYVANYDNHTVSYCPLNSNGSLGTCTAISNAAFGRPGALVFTPNGSFANVVNETTDVSLCSVSGGGGFTSCSATSPVSDTLAGIALNASATYVYITNYGTKVYSCAYTASTGAIGSCTTNTSGIFLRTYGVLIHPSVARSYVTRLWDGLNVGRLMHCDINSGTGALDTSSCAVDFSAAAGISGGYISMNSQNTTLYSPFSNFAGTDYVLLATVNSSTGNLSGFTQFTDATLTGAGANGIAVG